MLRAVRFSAGFGFVLEGETRAAIERLAPRAATVSPERIAAELRAMLSRRGRGRALQLLAETRLAPVVLPELAPAEGNAEAEGAWLQAASIVEALDEPSLEAGLAVLAEGLPAALPRVVSRLRLSNREGTTACWLRAALDDLAPRTADEIPMNRPWSTLQPWLANRDSPVLADLLRARAAVAGGGADLAAWVTACLERPRAELDPPPLLGGHDLIRAGCAPGPALGATLTRIRQLQLDGALASAAEALAWLADRPSPG
jgi:poly(A) polymerase